MQSAGLQMAIGVITVREGKVQSICTGFFNTYPSQFGTVILEGSRLNNSKRNTTSSSINLLEALRDFQGVWANLVFMLRLKRLLSFQSDCRENLIPRHLDC
jgi:hypothetical protein